MHLLQVTDNLPLSFYRHSGESTFELPGEMAKLLWSAVLRNMQVPLPSEEDAKIWGNPIDQVGKHEVKQPAQTEQTVQIEIQHIAR